MIYTSVRILIAALGLVPLRFSTKVARVVGAFAFLLAPYERKCATRQMSEALGQRLTQARAARLTRGVFYRLAQNAMEILRMYNASNTQPAVAISDASRRVLEEALAQNRGVIFVTGHLGNWELLAATLSRLGYPIHTVAKRSYDPRFTKLIEAARTQFGVRAVYRGDPGAAAAMLRVLRGNGILGFLIDQDTDVPSIFSPFFDKQAKTPTGPAQLALRTGAPMVVGTISRRRGTLSHRVDIVEVNPMSDVSGTTAILNRLLEAKIRRHPTEWVWFHRRWKSRPKTEVPA